MTLRNWRTSGSTRACTSKKAQSAHALRWITMTTTRTANWSPWQLCFLETNFLNILNPAIFSCLLLLASIMRFTGDDAESYLTFLPWKTISAANMWMIKYGIAPACLFLIFRCLRDAWDHRHGSDHWASRASTGEVVRIDSIIIFHLSKQRKVKLFILFDVIFVVKLLW